MRRFSNSTPGPKRGSVRPGPPISSVTQRADVQSQNPTAIGSRSRPPQIGQGTGEFYCCMPRRWFNASGHAESTARTAHGRLPHVTPTKLDLGTLGHSVPINSRMAAVLLRSFRAPAAVHLRSADQRTAANTGEYSPARPSVFGDFRPCSLAFAVLYGNRGAEIRTRDLTDPNRASPPRISTGNRCKWWVSGLWHWFLLA